MHDDFAQRRRLALAVAITVIAVPAVFLLDRGSAEPAETLTTTVGAVQIPGETAAAPSTTDRAPATDVMGTSPVGYLDGTVPSDPDDPTRIAVPRPQQALNGSATYSRHISDTRACQVSDLGTIPFNASVTVTNLDNRRSVQCMTSITGYEPATDIVLNADAFLLIGDVTDAPLSVEITW